jgi:hypothetical protein
VKKFCGNFVKEEQDMKHNKILNRCILPISLVLLSSAGVCGPVFADEKDEALTAPIDKGPGGILEAEVTHVETNVLLVKKEDGDVSRVPMPGESGKSAREFSEGDKIQAVITPKGTTTSVRKVPKENPNVKK